MKKAILARKEGMTQIYDESGQVIPVTVLKAGPCKVVQVKTPEKDGYKAVQVGYEELGEKKKSRVNQPMEGHYNKAGVNPCRVLKEFDLGDDESLEPGTEIKADIFSAGDHVDISGISKGKGFSGTIKRHGFGRGPKTHGSHHYRSPGSLGSVDSARVFKGTKLPGRMGGKRATILNSQIVDVNAEKNIIMVKGAVPGPRGALIEVKQAVKKS